MEKLQSQTSEDWFMQINGLIEAWEHLEVRSHGLVYEHL